MIEIGSEPTSLEWWNTELIEIIKIFFGKKTLTESEQKDIFYILSPYTSVIIKKVIKSIGFKLSQNCLSKINENPFGFKFTLLDIADVDIIIKHNIYMHEFSQGKIAMIQAKKLKGQTYSTIVYLSVKLDL